MAFANLGKPFYVGKGIGRRKYAHLNEALNKSNTSDKCRTIRAITEQGRQPIIVTVKDNLCEDAAYLAEEMLIESIGRNNLTNLNDGGGREKTDRRVYKTRKKAVPNRFGEMLKAHARNAS